MTTVTATHFLREVAVYVSIAAVNSTLLTW